MKISVAIFAFSFLSCNLAFCGADTKGKEVEIILQDRDTLISKANDAAVKKLEAIMITRTKKGDLDGALAVKAAMVSGKIMQKSYPPSR